LSEFLKDKYKISTQVVFWVEADDNDFDEISKLTIFDRQNLPVSYQIDNPKKGFPIGWIDINSKIKDTISFLEINSPNTEFKSQVLETLVNIYKEDENFADAFSIFLCKLLENFDIIYFNPNKKEVKEYCKNFFYKASEFADDINIKISEDSKMLIDKGYHNQVKVNFNNINLFYAHPFREPVKYGSDEHKNIKDIINNEVERISTNVLLRPLLQDYIFPDLVYIAGPSEISYFAQLKRIYRIFGLKSPIILPRNSFTLLNNHSEKMLEIGLKFEDLFTDEKDILKKMSLNRKYQDLDQLFDKSIENIKKEMGDLIRYTGEIDVPLSNTIEYARDKSVDKINQTRDSLKYRINARDNKLVSDIKRFKNYLLPNGKLQERTISFVSFLIRFGFNFPEFIYKKIELFNKNHRMIKIQ